MKFDSVVGRGATKRWCPVAQLTLPTAKRPARGGGGARLRVDRPATGAQFEKGLGPDAGLNRAVGMCSGSKPTEGRRQTNTARSRGHIGWPADRLVCLGRGALGGTVQGPKAPSIQPTSRFLTASVSEPGTGIPQENLRQRNPANTRQRTPFQPSMTHQRNSSKSPLRSSANSVT